MCTTKYLCNVFNKKKKKNILFLELSKKVIIFVRENKKIKTKMESNSLLPALQTIEQKLQQNQLVFTLGDAAAITGKPLHETKQVMTRLMEKYNCSLQITEKGDLIYNFGTSLHQRGERSWNEWWFDVKNIAWEVFAYILKVGIAVMLVVYFTLFLIILIAIIIVSISKGDGDSADSGIFDIIGGIFKGIFEWNTHTTYIHYSVDNQGYDYREYDAKKSHIPNKKGKSFTSATYDFVLGPPRVRITKEDNQKEIVAFLRKNKGIITRPEVMGLAGWRGKEADNFFSEIIGKYNGEAEISQNAVLYGDFYDLIRTKGVEDDTKIVWYWDEYEAEYKLTGNSFGRNSGIFFMNLFNLLFSFVFLSPLLYSNNVDVNIYMSIFLGLIPFIFSSLFFIVPIFRWINILPKRRKRNIENVRKRLMKAIFQTEENEVSLDRLQKIINQSSQKEKNIEAQKIQYMMQELILDLQGDIVFDNNGKIAYQFTQFQTERKEAEIIRNKKEAGDNLGKIVFDSNN
ncbi:MAG: hypothetical protein EAZ44_03170 [Cytophagia bacterium]|nr:MAG: hypothetical protein EAZ44_03170 [Cytophagia bacterium]TAG41483.1 MAG: hypothetical protein EAZ31_07475 [Cytophagia bacterium]TAH29883.1 MAG: hypothetical protein EAZ06_05220 [Cytophagales bacterium]